MTDISDEVRAFDPAATPILSDSPWEPVSENKYLWLTWNETGSRVNCIQGNAVSYPTEDAAARLKAIGRLKRDIEQVIMGDQEMDENGLADGRSKTAGLYALGRQRRCDVRIRLRQPFIEEDKADGISTISVGWGLQA